MTRDFNNRRPLLLVAALLVMMAWALSASPAAATDDESAGEALRVVQDYFNGKSSRAEALAAVGVASGGSGVLAPDPDSDLTTATSTNGQNTPNVSPVTAEGFGIGCANGNTPVVTSGGLPTDHEGSLDITLEGDPDEETVTITLNDYPDLDPIVVDVSACLTAPENTKN